MDLANKLIALQFDAVFDIYVQWFEADEHVKLVARDPNIRFEAEEAPRRTVFTFVVNVNGQEVKFFSRCQGGSWTNSYIDLGGRKATYGELADILSDVTAEMHYQLVKYAEAQGFPSENVMH